MIFSAIELSWVELDWRRIPRRVLQGNKKLSLVVWLLYRLTNIEIFVNCLSITNLDFYSNWHQFCWVELELHDELHKTTKLNCFWTECRRKRCSWNTTPRRVLWDNRTWLRSLVVTQTYHYWNICKLFINYEPGPLQLLTSFLLGWIRTPRRIPQDRKTELFANRV